MKQRELAILSDTISLKWLLQGSESVVTLQPETLSNKATNKVSSSSVAGSIKIGADPPKVVVEPTRIRTQGTYYNERAQSAQSEMANVQSHCSNSCEMQIIAYLSIYGS